MNVRLPESAARPRTAFPGMAPVWLVLALSVVLLPPAGRAASRPSGAPDVPNPGQSGQELAARLRRAGPEKSAQFTGTMVVSTARATNTFAIRSRTTLGETNWQVTYSASLAGTNVETLTIVRSAGGQQVYARSGGAMDAPMDLAAMKPLAPAELFQPFAGSHFWRIDLALEFIFWPGQRHPKYESTRGQRCAVLESSNPLPGKGRYSLVKSWLRTGDDVMLKAEAYDDRNRLLKTFLPEQVTKVNGVWQVESVTMAMEGSDDATTLRFDLSR